MTEREANFLHALQRFEDAGYALLDVWIKVAEDVHPFPKPLTEVCADLTRFRVWVADELADKPVEKTFSCHGCARTFATEKEHITHEIETGHGAPDAVQLWRKQCKAELDKAAGCDDRNSRAVRKARGALIK
jgi:hypothetical protein